MSAAAKNKILPAHVVLGLAAVLLYCAAWCFSSSREKQQEWTHATAQVVEMEWKPYSAGGSKGRSFPHVRFEAEDGESHTIRSRQSSRVVRCSLGDQVEVLYPPGKPREAVYPRSGTSIAGLSVWRCWG